MMLQLEPVLKLLQTPQWSLLGTRA